VDTADQQSGSSLFIVRVWRQENSGAQMEWRGRLVHVTSGRAVGFLDLSGLGSVLLEVLRPGAGAEAPIDNKSDEARQHKTS
jgi:hypothetical protein